MRGLLRSALSQPEMPDLLLALTLDYYGWSARLLTIGDWLDVRTTDDGRWCLHMCLCLATEKHAAFSSGRKRPARAPFTVSICNGVASLFTTAGLPGAYRLLLGAGDGLLMFIFAN